MDFEAIFARWLPLLKKYWLPLVLGFAGLLFFIYGLISILGTFSKPSDITFKSSSASNVKAAQATQNAIQIDIEGAVVVPGVYKLADNSILQDALVVAKGLAADADRAWIAKNLNLAAKLTDGAKIYIPNVGEEATQITNPNAQVPNSIGSTADLININNASSDSLDSLPGVGPATITKIVNGRPYQNINELLDKKIVSQKVFDEVKDKITVY
jgi:competence protein ComEA